MLNLKKKNCLSVNTDTENSTMAPMILRPDMNIAKKIATLPTEIQIQILRLSLIVNFNYTKDNPEWKWDHQAKGFYLFEFIKLGNSLVTGTSETLNGVYQEKNVYWKLRRHLLGPEQLLFSAWKPCTRYISTVGFHHTKTIPLQKMGVVYLFTKYKRGKKMPESHIKMIEPLIESNSCGKVRKHILHGDIPDESYDNALSGASPFWFYRNCRCQNCDGVRKLGYDQLSAEEKKKVKVVTKEYKRGLNPTAPMFVPKDLSTISRGMQKINNAQ